LIPRRNVAVNNMRADEQRPVGKADWLIAVALIAAGTAISAFALAEIRSNQPPSEFAQATQPTPSSPPDAQKNAPAEPKPGGTRPTTPAPEPARPDPDAQKAGKQPTLPPAPAEKMAPPIKDK
jgi:outer membrane biosynthesis protein TonB